jgi:hypothetical protein
MPAVVHTLGPTHSNCSNNLGIFDPFEKENEAVAAIPILISNQRVCALN